MPDTSWTPSPKSSPEGGRQSAPGPAARAGDLPSAPAPALAPALSPAPSFLDLFALRLASRLLGPVEVTRRLLPPTSSVSGRASGRGPGSPPRGTPSGGKSVPAAGPPPPSSFRLYWRSPELVRAAPSRADFRGGGGGGGGGDVVLFVDVALDFVAHPPRPGRRGRAAVFPRVDARPGALIRHLGRRGAGGDGGPGGEGGGGGVGGGGATYVRSPPLSLPVLRRYGDGIGIDLDETGAGPSASSLGGALSLLGGGVGDASGVARRPTARAAPAGGGGGDDGGGGGRPRPGGAAAVVALYHPDLDEEGEMRIEPAPGDDGGGGRVGETALEMLLSNLDRADDGRSDGKVLDARNPRANPSDGVENKAASEDGTDPSSGLDSAFREWWVGAVAAASGGNSGQSEAEAPPIADEELRGAAKDDKPACGEPSRSNRGGKDGDWNSSSLLESCGSSAAAPDRCPPSGEMSASATVPPPSPSAVGPPPTTDGHSRKRERTVHGHARIRGRAGRKRGRVTVGKML